MIDGWGGVPRTSPSCRTRGEVKESCLARQSRDHFRSFCCELKRKSIGPMCWRCRVVGFEFLLLLFWLMFNATLSDGRCDSGDVQLVQLIKPVDWKSWNILWSSAFKHFYHLLPMLRSRSCHYIRVCDSGVPKCTACSDILWWLPRKWQGGEEPLVRSPLCTGRGWVWDGPKLWWRILADMAHGAGKSMNQDQLSGHRSIDLSIDR